MPDTIIIRDEKLRAAALQKLLALDLSKPWDMTVKPHKSSRSLDQNALYWSWLGVIAGDTGYTADDIHEVCKQKFLPPHFVDIGGEVTETRRTTTKLKVDEMSAYMGQVEAWAVSELGIILPHPGDTRT